MLTNIIKNIIYCIRFLENEYHLSLMYYISLFIYNIGFMYLDSKQKLIEFREDKIPQNQKSYITNEWDSVKFGSREKIWQRFFESFLWPLPFISNIIPYIVLKFNTSNNKFKNM